MDAMRLFSERGINVQHAPRRLVHSACVRLARNDHICSTILCTRSLKSPGPFTARFNPPLGSCLSYTKSPLDPWVALLLTLTQKNTCPSLYIPQRFATAVWSAFTVPGSDVRIAQRICVETVRLLIHTMKHICLSFSRHRSICRNSDSLRTWKTLHLSFPSLCTGRTVRQDQNLYTKYDIGWIVLACISTGVIFTPLDLYEIEGAGNFDVGQSSRSAVNSALF